MPILKNKFLAVLLLSLGFSCFCVTAQDKNVFCVPPKDVTISIADYPLYQDLEQDHDLEKKFVRYMEWLAGLKVPDAVFVFDLVQRNVRTLEALSLIFHEKVELLNWLELGHRFEDIIQVDYYNAHYSEVYPIAHRRALIEEMNLIQHYAKKQGFNHILELAFTLVSPMVEQRKTSVVTLTRRLRFNPEMLNQKVQINRRTLETAVNIFYDGGYCYLDRTGLINEALRFAQSY